MPLSPPPSTVLWLPGTILQAKDLAPATRQHILDLLSPAATLAFTAWAEARSRLEPHQGWVLNPLEAQEDILNVVDNRTRDPRWVKLGHKGICLQPSQFSCWLPATTGNYAELMLHVQQHLAGQPLSTLLQTLLLMADTTITASNPLDRLRGATHYYSPASMIPPGRVPAWVTGARFVIERWGHRFYEGVR